MADINVERKSPAIWPWIVGLIILALLIWALAAALGGDDEAALTAVEPVPVAVQPAEPIESGGAALAAVFANPSAYFGQPFTTGPVTVGEVVGDRGFWIEGEGGQRLFVVKDESPREGVADVEGRADVRPARDVNSGDRLQIDGTLHDGANPDAVQPPLDATTRQALQGQPIFLQANVSDIRR